MTTAAYKIGPPYSVAGRRYIPAAQPGYEAVGTASWYGEPYHGRKTASGETFDMGEMTAAHPTLPLLSRAEVTNLSNGRRVTVRLNDRGPFSGGRIIDVSRAAAEALGFRTEGTAKVRVRWLDGEGRAIARAASPPVAVGRSGEGRWGVQAGAFADRGNAERAAERLRNLGRAAVLAAQGQGRTLHRVVLGPLADEGAAREARARVAAMGFSDARVIDGL